MNLREYSVLDALNIASTRHMVKRRPGMDWHECYQATAAQISVELLTDVRMSVYDPLSPREVGGALGAMAQGHPKRRAPLVERVGTRRWRLTQAGIEVLSA